MSSESTIAHVDAAVLRVRSFQSPTTGKTAALLCKNAVFNSHGGKYRDPETAPHPFVVLAKINIRSNPTVDVQEDFDIEALCHAKGRGRAQEAETLADLVQQALLTWRESGTAEGLTTGRGYTRVTLPAVEGSDRMRDVTTVRVTVACSSFPTMVTAVLA